MTIVLPRMDRLSAEERGITIGDFLVPIRVSDRMGSRVRHLALVAIGALVIALASNLFIRLPQTPVPITGQTFAVLLVGGALGFRRGVLATLLYLVLGLWFPVYAEHRHGLDVIVGLKGGSLVFGATGGYLVGFILAAAVVGRLAELGWDRRITGAVVAMVLGDAVIYLAGVPWLALSVGLTPSAAIAAGLTPFLVGDALKIVLAALVFPAAWWFVGRRPGER